MNGLKRILMGTCALFLCLSLCACDINAMLEGFDFFGFSGDAVLEEKAPAENIQDPTLAPTQPAEMTQPPTETAQPPTEPEPELYWVCAIGDLKVRNGPGRDYTSIGKVDDGCVVEPLRWVNGWAYIEYPTTGWCSGDYLHPLGWYNDVKLPDGAELEDRSLTGKWIHAAQLSQSDSSRRTRVGILELNSDGTFTHSVADYISYTSGRWKLVTRNTSRPAWEGEYQFDGNTLVLNYMAYLDVTYDSNGEPTSREWFTANYTLNLNVTKANDTMSFTIPSGDLLPCYAGFGTDALTLNTLHRAPNTQEFPEDVYSALVKWFG